MTMAEKKEAERLRFEVFNYVQNPRSVFVIYAGPKIFLLSMAFQKFNDIMKTSLQKKIEERMHDLIEGKYEERKSQSKSFTPSNVKQQYGKHGKHGNIDKSCENFYLILQNTDLLTE